MSWKKVRLKEVLQRVDRSEEVVTGSVYEILGVRWYGLGAYSRGEVLGEATTYSRLAAAKLGDVIINKIWTRKGSIAVIDEATQGLYCSPEFPLFEIDRTKAIPAWIKYVTQQPEFWLECENASPGTSGKNRITPERFLDISIPLPPLPVQRWIADALASVDEWIELERNAFTKSVVAVEKLADSFNEMDIAREKKNFLDICEIVSGQVDPKEEPYASMLHISPDSIESSTGRLLDFNTAKEDGIKSGKYLFRSGDVLYSKIRPNLKKAAIAKFSGICSADMYAITPLHIDSGFLLAYLLSEKFTDYAISDSSRSGIPKINRETFENLNISVPNLPIQKQMGLCFIEQINLIEKSAIAISTLNDVKSALLHQLLSGTLQPVCGWASVIPELSQAATT